MARRKQEVEANLKEVIEEFLAQRYKKGEATFPLSDPRMFFLEGLLDWMKVEGVTYEYKELMQALTELIKEDKVGIYFYETEDFCRVFFGPPIAAET